MNKQFIPPELQETFAGTEPPLPSAWIVQSIGNGRYAVTLPDGQQVTVDQHGKTSASNTPRGGMAHPSLRFSHMTNFYP